MKYKAPGMTLSNDKQSWANECIIWLDVGLCKTVDHQNCHIAQFFVVSSDWSPAIYFVAIKLTWS
jgi:hypothetical protein